MDIHQVDTIYNKLLIKFLKSSGVLTDGVADLAITLLLATARRVSEAMRTVRVSYQIVFRLFFYL